MLKEGTTIYFYVQGYLMQGKAVHIQGDKQYIPFRLEGYRACRSHIIYTLPTLHPPCSKVKKKQNCIKTYEAAYYLENTF